MFRFKNGVRVGYNRQGYIYFKSRLFKELPSSERKKIIDICKVCGGEYHRALLEFVTTDATATAICMKHYCSEATLYRVVRKYYETFNKTIQDDSS